MMAANVACVVRNEIVSLLVLLYQSLGVCCLIGPDDTSIIRQLYRDFDFDSYVAMSNICTLPSLISVLMIEAQLLIYLTSKFAPTAILDSYDR